MPMDKIKAERVQILFDRIAQEMYYGYNLRYRLRELVDFDEDFFGCMQLFFKKVEDDRLEEKNKAKKVG